MIWIIVICICSLLALGITLDLLNSFLQKRNNWVLAVNIAILTLVSRYNKDKEEKGETDLLDVSKWDEYFWSYKKMLYCFWVKDVRKFFLNQELYAKLAPLAESVSKECIHEKNRIL